MSEKNHALIRQVLRVDKKVDRKKIKKKWHETTSKDRKSLREWMQSVIDKNTLN